MPFHSRSLPTRPGTLLRLRGMVRRLGGADTSAELSQAGEQAWPPQAAAAKESMWHSLLCWLRDEPAAPPERLRVIDAARCDFQRAMADLDSAQANGLRRRVNEARSLRELWHLRTELYGLVARQLSQAQAEQRLAQVNRHFPAGTRGH